MKIFISLVSCIILLHSCAVNNKKTVTAEDMKFDKEGHRGCRGLMPENTIPAMLKAMDLNVTTLEMDTHITKDSQVVISHDPWFNPDITTKPVVSFIDTIKAKYILYDMDYAEISKFDVGSKPYDKFPKQKKIRVAKPLLSTLIDSVESYSKANDKVVSYNIEIKSAPEGDNIYHPEPGKFTDLVMLVINKKQIADRVIIQSFDIRSLIYLHSKYPAIKTSLLIEENDKATLKEQLHNLGFTPSIYSPHYSLVTAQLLKDCHDMNIKVIPWTVNDINKMKELKSMGVDGLISDYPDLYKDL